MWFSKVVFPEPRKPVRTVTGSLSCSALVMVSLDVPLVNIYLTETINVVSNYYLRNFGETVEFMCRVPMYIMAEAKRCDLLIIGAGPGGGSAAIHASRLGLSTIVVEADPEVGTPVHCGECLSDLAVQNLDLQIPDHVKALDVKGIRVIFPGGENKLLTEPGYVLEKHLFEQWLMDEATSLGAELYLNHRVTSMKRIFNSENQFSNWIIEGKGNEFPIECSAVIDASGVSGQPPNSLTWEQRLRSSLDSSTS